MEKDTQVIVVAVKQRLRRRVGVIGVVLLTVLIMMVMMGTTVEGVWCVARSGANDKALQSALDYACAGGADCGPIQQSGLCFLPNTLQAHASYAFNSFYQRNHMAATSCDFSATATLAKTDPSYGSCVYPSSPSTAGSITSNTTPTTNPYGTATPFSPTTMSPTTFGAGGGGGTGLTPNYMGPPISTTNESKAPVNASSLLVFEIMLILLLLSLAIY